MRRTTRDGTSLPKHVIGVVSIVACGRSAWVAILRVANAEIRVGFISAIAVLDRAPSPCLPEGLKYKSERRELASVLAALKHSGWAQIKRENRGKQMAPIVRVCKGLV